MAMAKEELKQEKLIAKLKLSPAKLLILNEILELERELTLLERLESQPKPKKSWKGRNFIKEIREEQRKERSGPVRRLKVKHLKK